MDKENKIVTFPKDFFTKARPHLTKKQPEEDVIPIKWPKEVLDGTRKVVISSAKEK